MFLTTIEQLAQPLAHSLLAASSRFKTTFTLATTLGTLFHKSRPQGSDESVYSHDVHETVV
ncbi:hypothetical protein OH492_20570 [Vibrio chagasii]|nr:hypothetical protein [Vibrio chagasii]